MKKNNNKIHRSLKNNFVRMDCNWPLLYWAQANSLVNHVISRVHWPYIVSIVTSYNGIWHVHISRLCVCSSAATVCDRLQFHWGLSVCVCVGQTKKYARHTEYTRYTILKVADNKRAMCACIGAYCHNIKLCDMFSYCIRKWRFTLRFAKTTSTAKKNNSHTHASSHHRRYTTTHYITIE